MRTFKVEGSGNLSDCCERGKSGTGVFPVDFESDALRICPDARVDALQQLNKFRDTLSVSGQSRRGSLVRPIIVAERSITSVVLVHGSWHMYVRHTQLHRTQFGIEVNGIDYQRIDPVCLYNCRQ